jgi:hypothetical protein
VKNLLVETTYPALALREEQGKPTVVSGIASETDTVNGNGRIYPRAVMEREVRRIAEDLASSNHAGLVDHPEGGAVSVSDIGLKFTNLWTEGNRVMFEAEIVPTQRGRDLEAVVRAGVRIGISSRGYGSAKLEKRGDRMVQVIGEDFELESFDAVVTPSVASARITSYESLLDALRGERPDIAEALERLANSSNSVQPETPATEEDMDIKTQIELADQMAAEVAAEAQAAAEGTETVVEAVETTQTAEVVEEVAEAAEAGTVEEAAADEVVAEATAESAVEAVESVEETVETPAVVAEARVDEAQLRALTERAEVAEARVAALEQALNEDANLRAALASLTVAIHDHATQGNFDTVAAIASCASSLEFVDTYYAGNSAYDSLRTDAGQRLADAVLAPIGALAARVARDKAAIEKTEGLRYGRRLQALLIAECPTAAAVAEQFDAIHARVQREMTGKLPAPQIKGQVNQTEARTFSDEEREIRRLIGLPS